MKNTSIIIGLSVVGGLGLGAAIGFLIPRNSTKSQETTSTVRPSGKTNPLCVDADSDTALLNGFEVDGQYFEFDSLPPEVRSEAVTALEVAYDRQKQALESAALRALLSKQKKLSQPFPELDELLKDEVVVTEKEVEDYYNTNKKSFPQNLSLGQLKATISQSLANHKKSRALQSRKKNLIAAGFKVSGARVCIPADFSSMTTSIPAFGGGEDGSDADVKALWATQFFCTECRRLWPKLDQISATTRIQVMAVGQPGDHTVAEMNRSLFCAGQQGDTRLRKFVEEAHRLPLQIRNEIGKVRQQVRKELPKKALLELERFEKCLRTDEAENFAKSVPIFLKHNNLVRPPAMLIDGKKPLGESAQSLLATISAARRKS
jgi:hypothetical protein